MTIDLDKEYSLTAACNKLNKISQHFVELGLLNTDILCKSALYLYRSDAESIASSIIMCINSSEEILFENLLYKRPIFSTADIKAKWKIGINNYAKYDIGAKLAGLLHSSVTLKSKEPLYISQVDDMCFQDILRIGTKSKCEHLSPYFEHPKYGKLSTQITKY